MERSDDAAAGSAKAQSASGVTLPRAGVAFISVRDREKAPAVTLAKKLIERGFQVIATEGTEFFQFCRDIPDDPAEDARGSEFYAGADLHIMGRVAYQSMVGYFPTATDDPYADLLNTARKVVFSRTLKTADWANTTIAAPQAST